MATLNIKGIPDALYRKLQARAKRERRSVAQEVIYLVSQAVESPAPLSVLELKGLGKEVWRERFRLCHERPGPPADPRPAHSPAP
ncbi:MAG: hypothetical protein ACE147_19820 [Candidatus Methylomirabilales bacterium]